METIKTTTETIQAILGSTHKVSVDIIKQLIATEYNAIITRRTQRGVVAQPYLHTMHYKLEKVNGLYNTDESFPLKKTINPLIRSRIITDRQNGINVFDGEMAKSFGYIPVELFTKEKIARRKYTKAIGLFTIDNNYIFITNVEMLTYIGVRLTLSTPIKYLNEMTREFTDVDYPISGDIATSIVNSIIAKFGKDRQPEKQQDNANNES